MQVRQFGRLDWQASVLGFGAMRLPTVNDDSGQIDEDHAIAMLRYAVDHGVNYVDTAYSYHNGTSERFLARALGDGYRERVRVATKMPCWLVKEPADFDRYLDEQLGRLGMAGVDFYLLHGLSSGRWQSMSDLAVLDWAERAIVDGRIGHFGFSFHDSLEAFCEIVDAYDNWALAQVQYNYMDVAYQAGTDGVRYAASKGLAVVVMEPLRGGLLARTPPPAISDLWDSAPTRRPLPDWALRWVWNQPEVTLALSGMSTMAQVVENVAIAAEAEPGALTAAELELIGRVRQAYQGLAPIPCTHCRYCLPCPSGVEIPRIFEIYNDAIMYGDQRRARMLYNWIKPEGKADQCAECGTCQELCPQSIEIIRWLTKAHQLIGQEPA